MTINDSETNAKRYTLRPTYTPLPHESQNATKQASVESMTSASTSSKPSSHHEHLKAKKQTAIDSVIRAANEDDDLYDPYSDYHDGTLKAAEFEKDPWR